ncbi:plasmid recombination protein, partial [Clostridioides difficile]|uniref:plasmid recombination protein n=1 Tax=Clostridioides difficile TaxID=1496 RepID=UPI000BC4C242
KAKVYDKDEDGKVLRNANGSPRQAKDENGKTIYRQVEELTAPKLSRTEFWRGRGGQTTNSQMQDRFHEEIGKGYGLERGEVGGNAKHLTKAQWEADQLKQELAHQNNKLSKDLTQDQDRPAHDGTAYRGQQAGIQHGASHGQKIATWAAVEK